MVAVINKSAVKKLALEYALVRFPGGKFTRVSAEFLENVDLEIRNVVRRRIHELPSVGKTIK